MTVLGSPGNPTSFLVRASVGPPIPSPLSGYSQLTASARSTGSSSPARVRFDGPWDWHPFDGAEPHEPAWPLTLLTRHPRVNATTAEAEVTVADATNTRPHGGMLPLGRRRPGEPSAARSPPASTAVVNSGEQKADGSAACSSPLSHIHTTVAT